MFRYLFFVLVSYFLLSNSSLANQKPQLTVYSYSSFLSEWGPGQQIKQGFEAQCDCEVNIISIGDGVSILNRLKLEREHTKADVVIGLDNNLIKSAKDADLVIEHGINKPDNMTIEWWDEKFVPYDYGYFAFIYDQTRIKNPPDSFESLLNSPEKWRVVYQDPRTSTPGLGLLLWVQYLYGDNAPQVWQKLTEKTLTITKGWSESYGLFLKGEADFVLSYSTSPAVHIINDNDFRYKAAIFDEGHYQQIEVAAVVKQSKQPLLAQAFLNYLLTEPVQQQFVEKNIMYPIIAIPLPKAYDAIEKVQDSFTYSAEEVFSQQQKIWIRQWQQAVSR